MTYLADHSLLLALPAFAPAFVVAGVVAWVAMKDRRAGSDGDETDSETPGSTDEDGSA
ncbi:MULTISPECIES: hypothetical protein [Mycobacteriaceae]|uniref:Uncharacterized protein n=1 Tax=Mycolicibacterium mucogenicum DSM 44124 TaxID=1226753 RepID=A0A8E4R6X7_MYCMU|nr:MULTISPECIES: hypothetical protein [Mycobacteriaceae]KAB7753826.1 hypothetical protein MMUC44124_23905 [Mycolicibacterium mucogenicum DSM 44124]QPG68980.1 hypothetical protein C1S78_026860 [Mycolicibacterium mucogenicum DSM 44124]SEA77727.1 hypothetical protein SAMN04488580_104292 [Mycobacterium sp. 283mftsu]